ncbi:MAG: hypothetical protein GX643_00905 [Acidimicrobiales bacterium]|nr:hypothetical protein [Acidimicrobiales bacterium]
MNGFLWLGVASTAVLLAAILFDGFDEMFDALDVGSPWLSLPVIAAFLAAFGFVAGASVDPLGLTVAVVAGVVAGVLFGMGAVRLSAMAMNMPTGVTDAEADLLASFGRIVTPTAPGRYGEVLLDRPAGPLKVACTADVAIPVGTEVIVVDVRSSTLVEVEPFDPQNQLDDPTRSNPQ